MTLPKVTIRNWEVPDYVIERVLQKRGRIHVFEALDPNETVFAVIDMQNTYLAGPYGATMAGQVIGPINRLAAELRRMGGRVVWVQLTAGEGGRSLWPLYHAHFFTPDKADYHRDSLTEGTEGHALHSDLDVQPGDLRAWKSRFSAFVPGCGNLEQQLQAHGIRNILIGGTVTNFCCETTGRDAMMLGYRVVMVADCNAARYPEDHLAGLNSFFQSFGDVRDVDGVLAVLEAGAGTA
jgi:nicotinamidase-related amidase